MRIDPADAASVQSAAFHQAQNFVVLRDATLWNGGQQPEDFIPIPYVTARDLSNNKRVRQHQSVVEENLEPLNSGAKVLHPDRCIDENHAARLGRLRRIGFR